MRSKTRRSWRWYANSALFWVADWCMDLGARVSQWEPPSESELEQSSMRIIATVTSRLDHPCPTCKGRGLVELAGDDAAVCHLCAGHGVDIEWLKAQAER
jgi:hypothetical protein